MTLEGATPTCNDDCGNSLYCEGNGAVGVYLSDSVILRFKEPKTC